MGSWQVAVVTGGGSGLGRALALELARRGAAVAVGDLLAERVEETVGAITAAGGRAVGRVTDVADVEALEALWAAGAALGRVDLMVNNAGVAVAGEIGEVALQDWSWIVDVNLMGVVRGCHVAAPRLRAQGRGALLNVASAAGLVSSPGMAPYNATKAAVVALSETLYADLKPAGVGVTVLCPTFFQTRLLDTARGDDRAKRVGAKLMARSAWSADEVARVALDDVAAGRLYSVPMADGRSLWRLKRLHPAWFQGAFARIARRVQGT